MDTVSAAFSILPWVSTDTYVGAFKSVVVSLVVFYCLCIATYRLFLSPLRSVPGPWYAALSEFWLTTHVLRLRRCRAIDELFKAYGPIVRIAPNKVAFLDAMSTKVVYSTSARLSKSVMYKSLLTNEHDHAMTTLDHGAHAIRKKAYSSHYTPTNVARFQPEVHDFVLELVSHLKAAANTPSSLPVVDTLELLRHLMIDINCAHIFAYHPKSLSAWVSRALHNGPPDAISDAISDFPKRGLLKGALPKWLWEQLVRIPNARWKKFCDSDSILGKFVGARVLETRALLREGKISADDGEKTTLITRLLSHRYPSGEPMPDNDIISECQAHIVAGTDTTSTTLSYILWELSRRRDIATRLQAELDAHMIDAHRIPDIHTLQSLPYLNAVLKEGLRIYTAAPSPLERIVPDSREGFTVLGHRLPAGATIGAQAWSTHRLSNIFPCPDLFLPDRWLLPNYPVAPTLSSPPTPTIGASASLGGATMVPLHGWSSVPVTPTTAAPLDVKSLQTSPALSIAEKGVQGDGLIMSQNQMQSHMFPFGSGARLCGGQNMAQSVLRIFIAAVARNFDIVAAPDTDEKSMDMRDSFVIFPAAMQCKLIFVPRAQ